MAIDLTTKFKPYVDEVFTAESKKSLLTNNDFDWTGAHTVKVYKISTGKMNDYDRSGTGTGAEGSRYGAVESLDATTEEFTLRRDRSFTFAIDKLDIDETQQQLAAASALARQQRAVVVPEVDSYTYGIMAVGAGYKPTAKALTTSNIFAEITSGTEALDNAEVPEVGRILVVTPTTYRIMKQSKDIVLDTEIGADMRLKGVIANLDGMAVIKVPASRLPLGFGFMIAHPCATVAPTKLEDYRVHECPPGISGSLVEGRICYDAFVLDNKKNAIYYQALPADGLTVTSEAGSASGKTKITVEPALTEGNSYVYKTAAKVDIPAIGEECKDGFTAWNGSADVQATTGNSILIVEVDATKKAVKAGIAEVTAKA